MSKRCPSHLSHDIADIRDYVRDVLSTISSVVEVRLWGSRSPKKPKIPREDSDWDILLVCEDRMIMPDPRLRDIGLYVDVASVSRKRWDSFKDKNKLSVQLYPIDEFGILK